MRVLLVYAHPRPESYTGALKDAVLEGLAGAGHTTTLCDLYARGFDPVLSADTVRHYYDDAKNRAGVENYVTELQNTDALILVYPTWWSGFPAILKGWFDRVWLPEVALRFENNKITPLLGHIRTLGVVTTYGGSRREIMALGNPGKKVVGRALRHMCGPRTPLVWRSLYRVETCPAVKRAAFLSRTKAIFSRL